MNILPPLPQPVRDTCIYLRSGQVIRLPDFDLTVKRYTGGGISALSWVNAENGDSRLLYINVEDVVAVTVETR